MINILKQLSEKDNNYNNRLKAYEDFMALPTPVYKRLGVKDMVFPEYKPYDSDPTLHPQNENPVCSILEIHSNYQTSVPHIDYAIGIDTKITAYNQAFYNAGALIQLEANKRYEQPIHLTFNLDEHNNMLQDYNLIVAHEGSEATIIISYKTNEDAKTFHNGLTKIICQKNSKVKMIKTYEINASSTNMDALYSQLDEDSHLELVTMDFTNGMSITNHTSDLKGRGANSDHYGIYLGRNNSKLDQAYTMNHMAPYCHSNIYIQGALMDYAIKIFRGNLDFKKEAAKSKGSEKEYVLLLNDTVKSDAIPALLCSEDDVEGEHAASAGQIDKNKLYYLMSRGLDELLAKKLVVEASFQPVIDRIPMDSLKTHVHHVIEEALQ